MPSDIEIAHSVTPRPIAEIAAKLDISESALELYGPYKAKIAQPAGPARGTSQSHRGAALRLSPKKGEYL